MNVPQLRFKGFEGQWRRVSIDELGEFMKGSAISKANLSEEGEPCILYGELYTKYSEVILKVFSKTNIKISKKTYGHKNDVLIPSSGETAIDIACASALEVEKILLGGDLNLFRPNSEVNGPFVSYQINGVRKFELSKLAQGASVVHLYSNSLKKFRITLPALKEQEKISSFLILLDKRIEKQKEKIEKLEQFKKGMMQKIFSQELRFKDEDGGEFPEWKSTTFYEVADIRRGASPRPIADPKWFSSTSKIGWLRISDVTASGVYLKEVSQYLSEAGIKKSVLLEEPHLILSIAATIGKPVINKIPLCIHDGFIVFKNLKLDILFGYYYLEHYQDKWLQFRQPGSQFNLNSDLVGNLNIMVPSTKEQEAIASFLSKLDRKIEKEKERLISFEEQKKGFIQVMFI